MHSEPSNRPRRPSYIPEFEGLRGLLAWWVVLDHMAYFAGYNPTDPLISTWMNWLMSGHIPVGVFIILSGFVIFFLLDKEPDMPYSGYMAGRFFRLVPVYWVLLAAAVLLLPLEYVSHAAGNWHDPGFIAELEKRQAQIEPALTSHVLLHIPLFHGLVPDQVLPKSGDAIIPAAWSLSLEWQFYLVAPLIYLLAKRHLPAAAVLCAAVVALRFVFAHYGLTFSYGAFLPLKFEYFALGMGSYLVYKRYCAGGGLNRSFALLLAGVAAAYVVMLFTGGMRDHAAPVAIWLVCLYAAMSRLEGSRRLAWISAFLNARPVAYVGKISYSTYLSHQMLIWVAGYGIVRWLGTDLSRGEAFAWMVALGGALTLLSSALLYHFVELPGISLGRWVRSRNDKRKVEPAVGVG